ncbi:MAG: MFS transporter [Planctomycetota bacterium JB042]
MRARLPPRPVVSWALYDWANSAFATTVMAGFFPIFFTRYWSAGEEVTETGWRLSLANSIAGAVVALSSPLLGAIADAMGRRKGMLFVFTSLGVVMTASLSLIERGEWPAAAWMYALAVIGFSGGMTFYDALLSGVTTTERSDRTSAFGYAAGYLGGGILFLVNVLMYLHPSWFLLPDPETAVRVAFASVAVWWAVFALPLFLFVPEPARDAAAPPAAGRAVAEGVRRLVRTFREVRRRRTLFVFLIAYWLYIDGLDTIVRMAVYYGESLSLPSSSLITALLVTQFVGFPATLVFGRLGERIGAKNGILIGLAVYGSVTVFGAFITTAAEFYALAVVIGLVQGAVQALSRSLFLRLVPAGREAQFYGFYNMLGKFAVVLGPVLMGAVGKLSGSPRAGILAVLALFVSGAILLARVDVERGRREAVEHP